MSKILITGGRGFIGSFTANLLNKKDVISIDNLSRSSSKNKYIKNYKIDISNIKKVSKIIKSNKITKVIHLASYTCVRESIKKEKLYKKNNYINQIKFINAAKKSGIKYFIFASSMSIFEKNKLIKKKPPYCKYKIMIENYLNKVSESNFKVFIVRYPNISGANFSGTIGDKNFFITRIFFTFYKKLVKNSKITLFYNKKTKSFPLRNYLHVMDIANLNKIILKFIISQNKKILIFNSNTNNFYSNKDILLKISKKLNIFPKYVTRQIAAGESLYPIYKKSNNLGKILNWKIKYSSINQIVNSNLKWFKNIY